MCGIAGYIENRENGVPAEVLGDMLKRLTHRGPDGSGSWRSENDRWSVNLGHRRLSIIDIAGGAQPLGNQDGTLQTTFNGEIFSFQELRKNLQALNHQFSTRSDTEVLVHHYEEWGVEGLRDLNGMFAFGIWDSRAQQLCLARDRAGIKPLYYAKLAGGGVAFASELSALLRHPKVPRELSAQSLGNYFFADYIHAPATAFAGVNKLPPAHYVLWKDGELSEPRAFWSLEDIVPTKDIKDETSLKIELWERMKISVERQLISDVPVGVFLSGGIDSSIVACLAQSASKEPIQTFTIAFEEKDFDESPQARLVAKKLGTRHVEETLSEAKALASLDQALDALDEPMADPSLLPTFLLSRLAARHVKVALGGDGGDELWAGYPTYRAHRYARYLSRVPGSLRRHVLERLVSRLPVNSTYQSFEWKAKRFLSRWDDDAMKRHLRWMSGTDLTQLQEAFPGVVPNFPRAPEGGDELNRLLGLDFSTYLPGSVLTKVDRASMAHGLEMRPPFLDNELVDWAFSLPSALKLKGSRGKHLLKEAAAPHLPSEILNQRKRGFAMPLARWLRGPLRLRVDSILRSSPLWESRLVSQSAFQKWQTRHQTGKEDCAKPLWALIVLDHWMRKEGLSSLSCQTGDFPGN